MRRRVTRRLTRLQTMYNVLKYTGTAPEPKTKFNLIMRMTVHCSNPLTAIRDERNVRFTFFWHTLFRRELFFIIRAETYMTYTSTVKSRYLEVVGTIFTRSAN